MKAFVLKQHEKTAPVARAIRDEELKSITGGSKTKCKGGKETTVTAGNPKGDDGCDQD